jgi:uracil-DNA glycosylase
MDVQIEDSWKKALRNEFGSPYFLELVQYLKLQKQLQKTIYPAGNQMFKAFELTPFNSVKVVILGQDPYHNPGQAHGLSFSVPDGVAPPPSLVNIYKELKTDLGIDNGQKGNLTPWAQQGVLLLNTALTVEANAPMSHSKIGWNTFTDAVLSLISNQSQNVVFILWGKFAQSKLPFLDASKHLLLTAAHPSPLSAHIGFWNCKHFSKTNSYLQDNQIVPINWKL